MATTRRIRSSGSSHVGSESGFQRPVTTRRIRRSPTDSRCRQRVIIGTTLVLIALFSTLTAGILGGPAASGQGQAASMLLIIAAVAGLSGLGCMVWGMATRQSA